MVSSLSVWARIPLFREEVRENQTCDFSCGFQTFLITYNKWKVSEDNAVTFNPSMLFYSVLLHSTPFLCAPFLLYLRILVMIHPVDWWFISGSCTAVRNWVTQLSIKTPVLWFPSHGMSEIVKFIERESGPVVDRMRVRWGRRSGCWGLRGFCSGWQKCSKIRSWWWLCLFTNIPKPTKLYILNGWIL